MRSFISTPIIRTGLGSAKLTSCATRYSTRFPLLYRPAVAASQILFISTTSRSIFPLSTSSSRRWLLLPKPLVVGRKQQKRHVSTEPTEPPQTQPELHESIYTLPNALTLARLCACPFLGYAIIQGQTEIATGLLLLSGFTDWLDGYLARLWSQKSVLGSILDPMADKALMTTLVVTLTYNGLLPLPLAILIFGRDFALSMWAFYLRYISLPKPRTIQRYFDPSMPSAEVRPTQISKINTALQLLLMGVTTISPILDPTLAAPLLQTLQWTVAGTTIWSGLSYVGQSGYRILSRGSKSKDEMRPL